MFPQRQGSSDGNCASTENLEAELESGNVNTGGSTTVTKSHSPSAIASDELSLAIGDVDIGHHATKRKRIQTLVLIQGLSNLTFVSHTLHFQVFPLWSHISYLDIMHQRSSTAHLMYPSTCLVNGVNSVIRSRNVYSNRQAPSKDIATAFAVQGSTCIRFTFSGSCYNTSEDVVRALSAFTIPTKKCF
ncbi:hypothetical protein EMCRGX_G026559 [Ephydatia muelleri]